MTADRGNVTQLTKGENDANPIASPDGKQIYFLRKGDLCRIDVEGKNEKLLTNGLDIKSIKFSPDGKVIFYLAQPEGLIG